MATNDQLEDWKAAVADDLTRLGFSDWLTQGDRVAAIQRELDDAKSHGGSVESICRLENLLNIALH